MAASAQVSPVYEYFTQHHVRENETTKICEVAGELLRLSKIMFQSSGWAECLPASEILFLAEVILQMGAHGIPGFDPRRISDHQYKIMYEATYSLVHTVLRNPTLPMARALERDVGTGERGLRIEETRSALLNVLNDRRQGVVVRIEIDY